MEAAVEIVCILNERRYVLNYWLEGFIHQSRNRFCVVAIASDIWFVVEGNAGEGLKKLKTSHLLSIPLSYADELINYNVTSLYMLYIK